MKTKRSPATEHTMNAFARKPQLIVAVVALLALTLSTSHLEAQTSVNLKKAQKTDVTRSFLGTSRVRPMSLPHLESGSAPDIASKNGGGTGTPALAVNGSGTAGHIARWKDNNTLESSVISQDSNKIGIGTTSPTSKLTVNGRIEALSGGFKFPDGSTQTTAFKVPLFITGAPSESPLVSVNSTGSGASAAGVLAQSNSGNGLHGISVNAFGVSGHSQSNDGVSGSTDGTSVFVSGATGLNFGAGAGVAGKAFGGGAGVFGFGNPGLAGLFEGNVSVVPNGLGQAGDLSVAGSLSKAGGSFKIDHPLDPDKKYLSHSFVESPDMMNIYNGNATLDANGEAIVELPDWYGALNKDARYLLTAIGAPGPSLYIAQKIANNHFKIAGGQPGMEVSWQVTGIRQDAWANEHRIPVEEQKSDVERGYYLHPELFNQPEEKSVEWARNPELMRRMKQEREQMKQQRPRKPVDNQ